MASAKPGQGRRIFMTGASGYIGSRVTAFAIAEGYTVHGLSRGEANDEKLRALGAVPVRGDISSLDVLRREAAAADVVIQLVYNMAGREDAVVRAEDAAAVDAMAGGMRGSGKPLLYASGSAFAVADPDGREIDETAPDNTSIQLHRRVEAERYALSLGDKMGIRVCSMRLPQYVYGRGASGVAMFMRFGVQAGEVLYPAEADRWVSSVHVDDAARLFLLVAASSTAAGLYNVTNSKYVRHKDILDAVAGLVGLKSRTASEEEVLGKWGPIAKMLMIFLSVENKSTSKKAENEFGWKCREVEILEEIQSGSYVALADEVKSASAAAV